MGGIRHPGFEDALTLQKQFHVPFVGRSGKDLPSKRGLFIGQVELGFAEADCSELGLRGVGRCRAFGKSKESFGGVLVRLHGLHEDSRSQVLSPKTKES